jgi:hypothetical protein
MTTDKTRMPENLNDGKGRLNKLSYRDGYIHDRPTEHNIQEDKRIVRDNNSAATGLLRGITLTAIAGLIVGASLLFLNHSNQPSTRPAVNEAPQTAPQP